MFYYVAQATSRKTARCDWLLTWQDYSVMTDGIMPIVNAMWKILKNNFKIILKFFFSLKINKILKWATKNIQTVNLEEQETTERNASRRGWHFDKVEANGDTGMKS